MAGSLAGQLRQILRGLHGEQRDASRFQRCRCTDHRQESPVPDWRRDLRQRADGGAPQHSRQQEDDVR